MGRPIIERVLMHARRELRYRLHPRALMWKHWERVDPSRPIITGLGDDLKVRVYPHDVIGKQIYVEGVFERAEWNFVKRYVKPGMTFLDLGANLGQFTLLAAKGVGKTGCVHGFEPSSRMFEELTFNVSLNEMTDVCVLNHAAVSDEAGVAALNTHKPGYEVYGSLGQPQWQQENLLGHEEVRTIRLDDYLAERGVSCVDFLKIDIEGAELLALKGADKLLSRPDAPAILVELADINTKGFGYQAIETWDYLVSFGYRMYAIRGNGRRLVEIGRPKESPLALNVVAMKSRDLRE